jgi:sugar phosphate isomerase/epimerase
MSEVASRAAVQMFTLREHTKTAKDLAESLAKVAAIGYPAVQLSAVGAMSGESPAVDARTARRMLDDNGLRCIATHRSWDDLARRTDAEIAFHRELGCDFTAIGGIPNEYRQQGEEGYLRFVREDAPPVIEKLRAAGIRWGHHNHDHEFARVEPGGRTLFDILIEEGGPDYLLEIDLYWAWHAGVDPALLVERCRGRAPILHLKDKEVVPGIGPTIAAVGEGNLPWGRILDACKAADTEWYAVEQDICRRDPFDCLRSSFEFLSAQGV